MPGHKNICTRGEQAAAQRKVRESSQSLTMSPLYKILHCFNSIIYQLTLTFSLFNKMPAGSIRERFNDKNPFLKFPLQINSNTLSCQTLRELPHVKKINMCLSTTKKDSWLKLWKEDRAHLSSLMNSRISCSSLSSIIRSLIGQKQDMIRGKITINYQNYLIYKTNKCKKSTAFIMLNTQIFKVCNLQMCYKKSTLR